MESGQALDCEAQAWEIPTVAAVLLLPQPGDVQVLRRQRPTEARLRPLARGMPGANRLTVAITARILAQYHLLP